MIEYNYNFEITRALKSLESALDDIEIRTYNDRTKEYKDRIKVNVKYGPKSRILEDLKGQPDTIKFPTVALSPGGMGRDAERVKNKLDDILYENEDGTFYNVQAIPWNIKVNMTILAKYYGDIEQIIQNFALFFNPYIVVSQKEAQTNNELRIEIFWDGGDIRLESLDPLPNNKEQRITAETSFTIKTWLFRVKKDPVYKICSINESIIPVDKFYCDYETLTANNNSSEKLDYVIEGCPNIRWVDPYRLLTNEAPIINLKGTGFNDTFALIVSGSNVNMYGSTEYFPGSAQGDMTPVYGQLVKDFTYIDYNNLSFSLPSPSATGFIDIIAVNLCGYGKLTIGANRCMRMENPYPISVPEHYSWCVDQYPYLNGLIVANELNTINEIDFSKTITVVDETIDRDALLEQIRQLMLLGNIDKDEI